MKQFDQTNYFENSQGIFDLCYPPNREPDYISFKKSFVDYNRFLHDNGLEEDNLSYDEFQNLNTKYLEVSSVYWYEDGYLYRQSDHWGYVASCDWVLRYSEDFNKTYCARINFNDLKERNDNLRVEYSIYDIQESSQFSTFEKYFDKRINILYDDEFNDEFDNDFDLIVEMEVKMYSSTYGLKPKDKDISDIRIKYKK